MINTQATKSKLAGDQLKIYKVWKKKKKMRVWKRVFQIVLEDEDNRNVGRTSGELWPSNTFAMQKTTFSKHWLIKISMACEYIKPEVKSNDTTVMTSATNEAWIGWWDENCYLMGGGMTLLIAEDAYLLRRIFLVGKMSKCLLVSWYSFLSPGFPMKV